MRVDHSPASLLSKPQSRISVCHSCCQRSVRNEIRKPHLADWSLVKCCRNALDVSSSIVSHEPAHQHTPLNPGGHCIARQLASDLLVVSQASGRWRHALPVTRHSRFVPDPSQVLHRFDPIEIDAVDFRASGIISVCLREADQRRFDLGVVFRDESMSCVNACPPAIAKTYKIASSPSLSPCLT